MKTNRSKDLARVEFDGAKRKVVFHGNCLELLSVCRAMCCREWEVAISLQEYASGKFKAEVVCSLTDNACSENDRTCLNRRYRLGRREDKSCVYLEDDRCRIYAERPRTCREFQCRGGWRLASVFSIDGASPDHMPTILTKEAFIENLTNEMIFVPHPLIKVHTVFHLKSKRRIIFIKEKLGACEKFSTSDNFDYPQLDDTQILMLLDLFNRKEPLSQVYNLFCSRSSSQLTQQEFNAIVWLLNKHNIVIGSRNFKGMLGGPGVIG